MRTACEVQIEVGDERVLCGRSPAPKQRSACYTLHTGTRSAHLVVTEFGSRDTEVEEDALGWGCCLELLDSPLDVACVVGAHSLQSGGFAC